MIQNIYKLIQNYGSIYLEGAWGTIWISFIVVLFGTILGGIIALGKMSTNRVIKLVSSLYIEIIRGTPLLLQLYAFYFIGPELISTQISDIVWILSALIINSSAYVSEIFRSGVQAVDKGQIEAALSLGLNKKQTMVHIIWPQALKNILPSLGNEFITMIKETSLASVFFINSLMTSEASVSALTNMKIESLTIVGIIYLIMTYGLSQLISKFERSLNYEQ